jgi:hypothetical protein
MTDEPIGPHSPEILEEEVSDELLLYDSEQQTFVTLNTTAADVWRLATGEYTLDGIVERIAGSYGVAPIDIRADIASAVRDLTEAGLLVSSRP